MLALVITTIGFLSRIIVHTPNFSPVLSLALFGGAYLKGRQPVWVPLLLMALSDAVLGFYSGVVYTWVGILLISLMGSYLRRHRGPLNIISASLWAAVVFFLVSNFGSFLSLYPHSWTGLGECYAAAIPFFRSTLVSTLGFSLVLFALGELAIARRENSIFPEESAV